LHLPPTSNVEQTARQRVFHLKIFLILVFKEYFVAFDGVCTLLKVRELSSTKIGKLLKITGQVIKRI